MKTDEQKQGLSNLLTPAQVGPPGPDPLQHTHTHPYGPSCWDKADRLLPLTRTALGRGRKPEAQGKPTQTWGADASSSGAGPPGIHVFLADAIMTRRWMKAGCSRTCVFFNNLAAALPEVAQCHAPLAACGPAARDSRAPGLKGPRGQEAQDPLLQLTPRHGNSATGDVWSGLCQRLGQRPFLYCFSP